MAPGQRVSQLVEETPATREDEPMTAFYEDDEPIEAVVAAFEDAPKGLTGQDDVPGADAED